MDEVGMFFLLFFIAVFVFITIMLAIGRSNFKLTENERIILRDELEKYSHLKKYTLTNNDVVFLNSSVNQMIHFIVDEIYHFEVSNYDYKDIIEVELVMDGEILTSTSRGSQLGGALVGGVLLGGAGAVVGGLSGKKSSKETVSQIYIKLTMLSDTNSIKKLVFLDLKYPIDKTSDKFKKIYEEATELEGKFKGIIHQIEDNKSETKSMSLTSNAEEVEKLYNLLTKGILTEEEFTLQKKNILSK